MTDWAKIRAFMTEEPQPPPPSVGRRNVDELRRISRERRARMSQAERDAADKEFDDGLERYQAQRAEWGDLWSDERSTEQPDGRNSLKPGKETRGKPGPRGK